MTFVQGTGIEQAISGKADKSKQRPNPCCPAVLQPDIFSAALLPGVSHYSKLLKVHKSAEVHKTTQVLK